MAQPHWLYLATFADGTTKVGTAAEPRKRSRLDEQGALIATYLAKSPDGRAVRYLEDALTRRLGLTQTVRAAAKLTALAELRDLAPARAAHEQHLARAAEALAAMNIPAMLEPWTPPGEGDLLRTPAAGCALYPHDLRDGEHGFTVVSCVGSQVLATLDARTTAGLRARPRRPQGPPHHPRRTFTSPPAAVSPRSSDPVRARPALAGPLPRKRGTAPWHPRTPSSAGTRTPPPRRTPPSPATYPMYGATSRDLARRADLTDADLVVDLCGGAGATARGNPRPGPRTAPGSSPWTTPPPCSASAAAP